MVPRPPGQQLLSGDPTALEKAGAGLSPEWAREEAEAVAETLAAVGGGVWEGDAPPSPRGKLRRRPGPAPGSLRGKCGSFLGVIPECAALTGEMWPRF